MCNYFEVYDVPYMSQRYREVKSKIEYDLRKKVNFKENLICVDSVIKDICHTDIRDLFEKKFIKKLDILEDDKTFVSDGTFKYIPRYRAEYDPGLYQIECCLLVYDEYDNILLLQKNKNRSDGLTTMIQGHVAFSREVYTSSKQEFIKENMIREIREEVRNFPKIKKEELEHCGYLFSHENLIKMIHIGVLYKCKIPHSKLHKIVSNEPIKHSVIIINRKRLINGDHDLNIDPWLKLLLEKQN